MFLAIIVSACAVFITRSVHVYLRLSAFPGPFIAAFTGWWRVYRYWKGDFQEVVTEWHKTHGPVIRIGPNSLSVADATNVPKVYGTNPVFRKGSIYKVFSSWYRGKDVTGIESILNEDEHTALKRAVVNSFSLSAVSRYEPELDECTLELMRQLEELDQFDLTKWIEYFSHDITALMAFSTPPHYMKHADEVVDGVQPVLRFLTRLATGFLPLTTVVPYTAQALSWLVGPSWRLVSMALDLLRARENEQRSLPTVKKHDMLDTFITAQKERPDLMAWERLLSMITSIVIAGPETVNSTLITTIYHLLKHRNSLNRLQQELHHAHRSGELSYMPTLRELSKLAYLDAVTKEGLRCLPSIALHLERIVPTQGMELSGYFIPGGTEVGCLLRVIHTDQSVYGHDADTFRPERWIEATHNQQIQMERCGLWFGNGKRNCIGQHIGIAEMKKLLAALLLRFEISDVDPDAQLSWNKNTFINYTNRPYYVALKRIEKVGEDISTVGSSSALRA
ncbi:uncharacterized protein AKAW2_12035S [Aspergillus luchuensis]|uniref:Pisatin demethylase n=1 Tax=Aspergillus kawachii TaxID=1069201 RepID=A0A146EZP8_ASPKA|nr:uncharacterized protein AKAW2_12035S [Aspergillus luchuensis]BCR94989.1 hypothetical protein AKAW2_12035S [Aspergillus luchuensis]GAA92330.1 pisatin demethylase [Aspergillus luchuensis IFO 4308]GAT19496.1 pisatin demethylase [Aspergillus luchuensis]